MKSRHILCMAALFLALSAGAKPVLPPLFTDNMVFQQQTDAPIWGQARAGRSVTITPSWSQSSVITQADANGQWRATLPTPAAGGPYTVTISDGQKLVLQNVMVGEVWLCSGQSNMEMPIDGWTQVLNYEQEKQDANLHPNIRLLQVHKNTSPQPLTSFTTNLGGGWQVCSAESVKEFSAAGYFFGRDLNRYQNVPIGLIDASWGGTFIEPWTSAQALATHPDMREAVDLVASLPASKEERLALYEQRVADWKQKETALDAGYSDGQAVWAQPAFDDSAWPTMGVPVQWERAGLPDYDGVVWMRLSIDVPKAWAGHALTLSLGRIDDLDYTFFNGEEVGHAYDFGITRLYTVPARLVKAGRNVLTVRVIDTGGGGGIYSDADQLYLELKPGQRLSLAGEWRYQPSLALADMPQAPVNDTASPNMVTLLYNAMINPLVPFAMQGAIWYQGENNENKGYQYRELLPLMIRDWRNKWQRDFPFYIVQLANYGEPQTAPEESRWAEVREAQSMAAKHVQNAGMACIIDIGEAYDIHPRNKQEVGRRLALLARANTYGEQVECAGPQYRSYQIEGQRIRLFFDHADGLHSRNGEAVKGFVIAGQDHQFHWAEARIEGNTVVVQAADVVNPVAVRYAWAQNPQCNLYNGAGLPAEPFRTDDWPGVSINNHRAI